MEANKHKLILFDFDGVIADTFDIAFGTAHMICPHLTEEVYKRRFEGNINDSHEWKEKHTSECQHDRDFFEEYVRRLKAEGRIVPGMREAIYELERSYALLVISSTISSPITEFLEQYELDGHFDWIMGNDVHKSKVEKMRTVLKEYNVGTTDCVFVTDTLGDLREAEKAGVGSIAVTWGFHTIETLKRGRTFCMVDSPAELSTAVDRFFEKK